MTDINNEVDEELCECGLPIHPCIPCEEVIQMFNHVDSEYFRLLNTILDKGNHKKNRTGVDTIGVFGEQAKFDVDLNAFPILTTKKVWFKGIVHELLWFIKGDTNIKYLVDNDVHIWDEWAYKKYKDYFETHGCCISYEGDKIGILPGKGTDCVSRSSRPYTQKEFIQKIKEDAEFAKEWGELGEGTYGGMWRAFPYYEKVDYPELPKIGSVDQLQKVIDKLKSNPDDRRMIVSAWHPYLAENCALSPCHCFMQFNTEELTIEERIALYKGPVRAFYDGYVLDDLNIPKRRLNLLMLIRSNDMFLGAPFNLTSYSLLIAMVSQCVGMLPGTLTYTIGDCHLYVNHMEQVKEQMKRTPMLLPKLWLNPEVEDLFSFKYEDIKLIDYNSHPAIKADVAV